MYNRYGYYGIIERHQIERAVKMARFLNIIGIILSVVILFSWGFEKYILGAGLIAPVVFSLIVRYYKGTIIIDFSAGPYPTVIWGLGAIILSMVMKQYFSDNNTLEYQGVWVPSIIIAALFCIPLLIPGKDYKFADVVDISGRVMVMMIAFSYGLISTFMVNEIYDTSSPQTHQVTVLDKKRASGRRTPTTYSIVVSPWAGRKWKEKAGVDKKLYDKIQINDQVNIEVSNGSLGIPWFVVKK